MVYTYIYIYIPHVIYFAGLLLVVELLFQRLTVLPLSRVQEHPLGCSECCRSCLVMATQRRRIPLLLILLISQVIANQHCGFYGFHFFDLEI